MNFNLKGWLTANLGTKDTVSTLILVLMTILIVFLVWWLSKKTLRYFVPKLTAKTDTLWDDIVFNDRIINSFATLIPAIILDQSLPILFRNSTFLLPFILGATDVIIFIVSLMHPVVKFVTIK